MRVFLTSSQVTSLLLVQDDSLSGEAQTLAFSSLLAVVCWFLSLQCRIFLLISLTLPVHDTTSPTPHKLASRKNEAV